ncbi:MAG: response regulator [Vallitaleaceae bacterium]|jgi:HD-like signal output (HDOD) protein|nr:response regulator [Vallitaleaceae bacterium]
MKTILFVDDETQILKAFVRAFVDSEFDVITADSGEEALKTLETTKVDLVISDMRMPGMDGYDFLSKVKTQYPDVLRIILSGYSDEKIVFKALQKNVAKLYMFKPWENEKLKNTIINVLETQDILCDHDLLTLINNVEQLPTIPDNYVKVIRLIEEDRNTADISRAIERDQSMASKVLHVANSAYYGGTTGSIQQAVAQIGLKGTRELVLSASVIDVFSSEKIYQNKMVTIWDQAFVTNKLLGFIYTRILEKKLPANFQSAGLLHNIGVVFLLNFFGKEYLKLMLLARNESLSLMALEKETFKANHVEAGGYLMDWWGFPFAIVEAALYHHEPFNEHAVNKELIYALHVAQYHAAILTGSEVYEPFDMRVYDALHITQESFEKELSGFNA